MKYFTRRLYDAQQGNPDSKKSIKAEQRWDKAVTEYQTHLKAIRKSLPRSMQSLCKMSLHDGIIKAFSRKKDKLTLKIDGCGCWGPGGKLVLTFSGLKATQGLDNIIDDWWLYEEVHLSSTGKFEYHVLLQYSELIVVADEIELKGTDL